MVSKFEATTSMENEIHAILESSGLDDEGVAAKQEADELAENELSPEQIKARYKELAKLRALMFYDEQKRAAKEAGIDWKRNGLRHSYASYRFAQTMDAGRVAGELGNSAAVVHRHYRELVTPKAGEEWFAMKPSPEVSNIISAVG